MTRLDFWQFWNSLNFVCAAPRPPVVQAPFPFCFSLLWKETFVFCLSNSQKTNYNHLAPIGTQMGFLHLFTFYKKHLYIFFTFHFQEKHSHIFLHFIFRSSIFNFFTFYFQEKHAQAISWIRWIQSWEKQSFLFPNEHFYLVFVQIQGTPM